MLSYLEHLRRVNFLIVLVSFASMYLCLTNWNPSNALTEQVSRLKRDHDALAEHITAPEEVSFLANDWMENVTEPIRAQFEAALGQSLLFAAKNRVHRVTEAPFIAEFQTVGEVAGSLAGARWEIEILDKPKADWRSIKRRLGGDTIRNPMLTVPVAYVSVTQWPSGSDPGRGVIKLAVQSKVIREGFRARTREVIDSFSFQSRSTTFPSGSDRLYAYPVITQFWDSIATRSIKDAVSWASNLRSDELRQQRTEILGVNVNGEDLAYVVPAVLIILLMYLAVCVSNIMRTMAKKPLTTEVIPWLVIANDPASSGMAVVTLVFLPAMATFLMMWNQAMIGALPSVSVAVVVAATGAYCAFACRQLAVSRGLTKV